MICPKCASAHTMSTTKKESFRVTWMVAGWKDLREDAEIKAVTHRCLDCGRMWDGQEENQGSSQAMGNISHCPAAVEEPEEEV